MKYFFWILGCAMNYSDAERISAVLDSLGYTKTDNEKEADLFIVIACSVRESAVLSIYGKVRDLNEMKSINPNFKTILTGCVLAKDKKKLGKVFDVMMEIKDLGKLPELLGHPSNDDGYEKSKAYSSHLRSNNKDNDYLTVKPHYESTFRAYVPISTGCDNFCSYCAVPYTKGREKSRPAAEIVNEVRELVEKGYKEITLLGQNVNSYGHDITGNLKDNSPFIALLSEIDQVPGDYRVYFYSNHPKDMTDELIECLATLKHFPHYIHLPLQSGNDEIIRKMNRHYTKEQYLGLVGKIRKAMPDVNLTTDIIVGYPGETEKQFQDTADVMRKARYDMAFIAQYSPRPGTVSAKQPDNVAKDEKIKREKTLQTIIASTSLEHNQKLVGTTQKVLIDERKKDKYFGRTEGFKVVEVTVNNYSSSAVEKLSTRSSNKTDQPLEIGQFIDVKIESVSSWKLTARL